jgi:hypothetical protein
MSVLRWWSNPRPQRPCHFGWWPVHQPAAGELRAGDGHLSVLRTAALGIVARMATRYLRLTWLPVLVIMVAACGSGASHSSGPPTAAATSAPQASSASEPSASGSETHFSFRSDALVTMREYSPESLLWQTVSVNANGAAVLTTLIGEQTGATQKSFQLSARQAAALRRLVAGARTVRPPRPNDPRATLYTLHIAGLPAENLEGRTPPRLTALATFLANLMLTECC